MAIDNVSVYTEEYNVKTETEEERERKENLIKIKRMSRSQFRLNSMGFGWFGFFVCSFVCLFICLLFRINRLCIYSLWALSLYAYNANVITNPIITTIIPNETNLLINMRVELSFQINHGDEFPHSFGCHNISQCVVGSMQFVGIQIQIHTLNSLVNNNNNNKSATSNVCRDLLLIDHIQHIEIEY